ncbi:TIGR01777 family oxidoreductase [Actinocorallia longicatena]|uniref:TIGR01777 family oxidoreductase n=1 Tax=Actinocorallia longicatena TaxID=111803 RepID=A0ABP6QGM1_9ACTN
MRAVVAGASGLIGNALVESLRGDGWEVVRLVRREPSAPDEARWNPATRSVDRKALEGADAVVNLAGAGVGDRPWTRAYKQRIRDSRILGTGALAEAMASLKEPPGVFVCGSAVGFYGDTGAAEATEDSGRGTGFLAELVEDWEAAAAPAAEAGIRVVFSRTGIVLAPKGGLLGRTLLPFRFGLGAQLGDGHQWMSWISLDDEVRALRFLIDTEVSGVFNLTAPHPVTNGEFTKALGRALHRPAPWFVPAAVLKLVLRDFAEEGPLISQRVLPRRLREAGFIFTDPTLDPTLRGLLS